MYPLETERDMHYEFPRRIENLEFSGLVSHVFSSSRLTNWLEIKEDIPLSTLKCFDE